MKKNSNTVKKIGRMILDRLEEYDISIGPNQGVVNMLSKLQEGSKRKQPDRFNTSHLQALFDGQDNDFSTHNLRITHRIFSRELRREVLGSSQLKGENILVYLNTFKCCSLRFMSRKLAYRLQASYGI